MKPKLTASKQEPAERPHACALSRAELLTLVNYHARESRRAQKRASKLGFDLPPEAIVLSVRNVSGHVKRARELRQLLD